MAFAWSSRCFWARCISVTGSSNASVVLFDVRKSGSGGTGIAGGVLSDIIDS